MPSRGGGRPCLDWGVRSSSSFSSSGSCCSAGASCPSWRALSDARSTSSRRASTRARRQLTRRRRTRRRRTKRRSAAAAAAGGAHDEPVRSRDRNLGEGATVGRRLPVRAPGVPVHGQASGGPAHPRSEEHTSELQSPCNLVCRLLLEKKKKNQVHKSLTTKTKRPE